MGLVTGVTHMRCGDEDRLLIVIKDQRASVGVSCRWESLTYKQNID